MLRRLRGRHGYLRRVNATVKNSRVKPPLPLHPPAAAAAPALLPATSASSSLPSYAFPKRCARGCIASCGQHGQDASLPSTQPLVCPGTAIPPRPSQPAGNFFSPFLLFNKLLTCCSGDALTGLLWGGCWIYPQQNPSGCSVSPVHGGSGEFRLVLAKLGWQMFSLVKVKHLQTEGKSERETGEGFQQGDADSPRLGHCPALSDPHVLRGGGLHENWGHLKFLCGMAEKQPGCSQGDPARDAGANGGEEHPCASPGRGASAPGCAPVASRQT